MALPVTIPNTFANATASIPLSQLDTNFNTLANAVNGISDGSETLANASVTVLTAGTANVTTLNTSGQVVFNDAGADVDFRVEGNTDANLLFVDASADSVGVGTNTPSTYGKFVAYSSGGHFAVDANGQVNSTQALDVATAGGRFTGSSSRGALGAIHIEQTTTGADGGYMQLRTSASGSTTPTTRMTIDSSGNVLIGTSTKQVGTAPTFWMNSTTAANGGIGFIPDYEGAGEHAVTSYSASGTVFKNLNIEGNTIKFWTGSTTTTSERMRIDSSGNLLVGTTSQFGSGTHCVLAASGKNAIVSKVSSTDNLYVGFDGFGSATFIVASNGNVTNTNNSYGAISDLKLKQDIVDASSQWDDIKSLRVRKYRFKSDPNASLQIGLVAQEVEEVSAGLVDESQDYEEVTRTREVEKTRVVTEAVLDEDGNEIEPAVTETYTEEEEYTERVALDTTTKSVKYSVLYMKAVKALQEAMERIETLEASNTALEARIAALENA